jgi:serine/threonine protein kinase
MRLIPPHENIIRLRYCAVEPDPTEEASRQLTLFMDYLPTNLQHLIQDHTNGMDTSFIQIYSKHLFRGLAHLASLNIVHRDVLPRNILIDPVQQTLKLADFGCAKVVTPEIPNHPTVGTWQYRALELLFRATHYGPKAGNSHLNRRELIREMYGLRGW